MIQEIYRPAETPDAPFIFHLQTTHGSPEGARRTAEIIRYLEKQYGIKAVFAEGAGGILDPDFFKFFPDQRENGKMLGLLTQKGDLTGPDLALPESRVPFEGIEDAALYRRAFHLFRKVTENSEKTGLFIKARRLKLDAEASSVFSPQLREILDVWEKYQDGSRDMGALTDFIRAKAEEHLSVDFENPFSQFDYPQMSRLVLLKEIEKRADKNLYDQELKKLNSWLAENRIRTGFADLLDRRVPAPRKSFEEFLKQAAPKGFRFALYPRIHERAVSRVLESELRGPELFREMDRIFLELFQKLAKTSGETRLLEEYRRLFLLKKLLSLQLTRDEWQNVRSGLSSQDKLLNPENSPEMLPLFRQALAFYRACEKRELVFFEKISAGLKSHGARGAVLVTGGFHASGMARIFRDRHFSYASVLPDLSGDLDSSLYHAVMLGQAHLEKPEFAQPAGFADVSYYRAEMARVRDAAASMGKEISSSAKYIIDREAFAGYSAPRRSEMRPPEAATRVNQAMAFLSSEMPGMEVQYGFEPGRVQHLKSGGAFLASEFDSIRGGFDLLGLGENDRYFSFGSGTGRDVLAANAYGVRFAAGEEANDQLVNASLGMIFGKQGIPALAAERGLKVFDTAKISIGKKDWFKDGLLRPEARKDIAEFDVFHYFIYGSTQEEQMFRILGARMHDRAVLFLHDPWNTDDIPGMVELTAHGRRHWRSEWVKGVRILVPTESELIRLVNPGPAEGLDARAAEVKKIYFAGWKYTQRLIELLANFPAADEVMLHVPDRSASDVLRTMYGFFRGAGQGEGGIQVLGPDRWKLSFRGREWTLHFIQEPFSSFKGLPLQADAAILEEPEELGLNHRRDNWAGAYFEKLRAGLRPGGLFMLQNSDRYYFPTELEWARKSRIAALGIGHLVSYPETEWRVFESRSEMRAVDVKAAQTLLRVREKQVEAEALRVVFRNLPRVQGRSLKLLDLGGGDGELTAQAVREAGSSAFFFNETVSVEKDSKRVRTFNSTRKFPGLRLIEGDFFSVTEELEKAREKFDAILLAFSILFVPIDERDRLFRRLVRMSRENGRIIFLVNGKQRLPRNQVRARDELMTRHRVTAEDAETNFDQTFADWGHQVETTPIHVVFETPNRDEAIALVAGVLPSEDRDFKRIGAYADRNLYDAERKIYHFEIDEDLILVTLQTPQEKPKVVSPQKLLKDFVSPILASGHSLSFLEAGGEVYVRKDGEGLQGFPAGEIAQAVRLLFQNAREIRPGALPMISVQAGTETDDFMTAVQWILARQPDMTSHKNVLLRTQPLIFNDALIDSLIAPDSGEEIFDALTRMFGASQQLVISPVKRSEMRASAGGEKFFTLPVDFYSGRLDNRPFWNVFWIDLMFAASGVLSMFGTLFVTVMTAVVPVVPARYGNSLIAAQVSFFLVFLAAAFYSRLFHRWVHYLKGTGSSENDDADLWSSGEVLKFRLERQRQELEGKLTSLLDHSGGESLSTGIRVLKAEIKAGTLKGGRVSLYMQNLFDMVRLDEKVMAAQSLIPVTREHPAASFKESLLKDFEDYWEFRLRDYDTDSRLLAELSQALEKKDARRVYLQEAIDVLKQLRGVTEHYLQRLRRHRHDDHWIPAEYIPDLETLRKVLGYSTVGAYIQNNERPLDPGDWRVRRRFNAVVFYTSPDALNDLHPVDLTRRGGIPIAEMAFAQAPGSSARQAFYFPGGFENSGLTLFRARSEMRMPVSSEYQYYVLNKVKNTLSDRLDGRGGWPSVFRALAAVNGGKTSKFFMLGRLDADVEGLMLFSDDPAMSVFLTPLTHIEKHYRIVAKGRVTAEDIRKLENRVWIDTRDKRGRDTRYLTKTARADLESSGQESSVVHLYLTEGKWHQVKLMMEAVGHPVLYLERVGIGPLDLDDLHIERGKAVKLTGTRLARLLSERDGMLEELNEFDRGDAAHMVREYLNWADFAEESIREFMRLRLQELIRQNDFNLDLTPVISLFGDSNPLNREFAEKMLAWLIQEKPAAVAYELTDMLRGPDSLRVQTFIRRMLGKNRPEFLAILQKFREDWAGLKAREAIVLKLGAILDSLPSRRSEVRDRIEEWANLGNWFDAAEAVKKFTAGASRSEAVAGARPLVREFVSRQLNQGGASTVQEADEQKPLPLRPDQFWPNSITFREKELLVNETGKDAAYVYAFPEKSVTNPASDPVKHEARVRLVQAALAALRKKQPAYTDPQKDPVQVLLKKIMIMGTDFPTRFLFIQFGEETGTQNLFHVDSDKGVIHFSWKFLDGLNAENAENVEFLSELIHEAFRTYLMRSLLPVSSVPAERREKLYAAIEGLDIKNNWLAEDVRRRYQPRIDRYRASDEEVIETVLRDKQAEMKRRVDTYETGVKEKEKSAAGGGPRISRDLYGEWMRQLTDLVFLQERMGWADLARKTYLKQVRAIIGIQKVDTAALPLQMQDRKAYIYLWGGDYENFLKAVEVFTQEAFTRPVEKTAFPDFGFPRPLVLTVDGQPIDERPMLVNLLSYTMDKFEYKYTSILRARLMRSSEADRFRLEQIIEKVETLFRISKLKVNAYMDFFSFMHADKYDPWTAFQMQPGVMAGVVRNEPYQLEVKWIQEGSQELPDPPALTAVLNLENEPSLVLSASGEIPDGHPLRLALPKIRMLAKKFAAEKKASFTDNVPYLTEEAELEVRRRQEIERRRAAARTEVESRIRFQGVFAVQYGEAALSGGPPAAAVEISLSVFELIVRHLPPGVKDVLGPLAETVRRKINEESEDVLRQQRRIARDARSKETALHVLRNTREELERNFMNGETAEYTVRLGDAIEAVELDLFGLGLESINALLEEWRREIKIDPEFVFQPFYRPLEDAAENLREIDEAETPFDIQFDRWQWRYFPAFTVPFAAFRQAVRSILDDREFMEASLGSISDPEHSWIHIRDVRVRAADESPVMEGTNRLTVEVTFEDASVRSFDLVFSKNHVFARAAEEIHEHLDWIHALDPLTLPQPLAFRRASYKAEDEEGELAVYSIRTLGRDVLLGLVDDNQLMTRPFSGPSEVLNPLDSSRLKRRIVRAMTVYFEKNHHVAPSVFSIKNGDFLLQEGGKEIRFKGPRDFEHMTVPGFVDFLVRHEEGAGYYVFSRREVFQGVQDALQEIYGDERGAEKADDWISRYKRWIESRKSEMRMIPPTGGKSHKEELKANEVEVRLAKLSEIYRVVFERRRLAGKKVLGNVSDAEDTGVGLFLPAREILVEKIESYMDIPEDGNIMLLDAGSGAGHFLLRFLIRNPKIKKLVGIEWNQELYEESRDVLALAEEQGLIEKGRIEFYQGDFLDTRWRSYFAAADRIYYGQFGSYNQRKLGALIRDQASHSLRVVTWGISSDPFPLLVRSKKFSSRRPERNIVVYSRRSEVRARAREPEPVIAAKAVLARIFLLPLQQRWHAEEPGVPEIKEEMPLGQVSPKGDITIEVGGKPFKWKVLRDGETGAGWTAFVESGGVRGRFYELHLRLVQSTARKKRSLKRRFQVGVYRGHAGGGRKPVEFWEPEEFPGQHSLTTIQSWEGIDWKSVGPYFPDLAGQRAGVTGPAGVITMPRIIKYLPFEWKIPGIDEPGWEAVIESSRFMNGVFTFTAVFTRLEDGQTVRKTFRIGPGLTPLGIPDGEALEARGVWEIAEIEAQTLSEADGKEDPAPAVPSGFLQVKINAKSFPVPATGVISGQRLNFRQLFRLVAMAWHYPGGRMMEKKGIYISRRIPVAGTDGQTAMEWYELLPTTTNEKTVLNPFSEVRSGDDITINLGHDNFDLPNYPQVPGFAGLRSEMRSAEAPVAQMAAVVSDQTTTHGRRAQGVMAAILKYSVRGTKVSIYHNETELPPDSFTYLYMAITPGNRLRIRAEGPDASTAAQELKSILEDDMPASSVPLKNLKSEMRTSPAIRRAIDAEIDENFSRTLDVPLPEWRALLSEFNGPWIIGEREPSSFTEKDAAALMIENGKDAVDKVAMAMGFVEEHETVLDIGPGPRGGLAFILALKGARVTSFEKDPEVVAALNEKYARLRPLIEQAGGSWTLVQGDFSKPEDRARLSGKFQHIVATDVVLPERAARGLETLITHGRPATDTAEIESILDGIAAMKSQAPGFVLFSIPTNNLRMRKAYVRGLLDKVADATGLKNHFSDGISVPYSMGVKYGNLSIWTETLTRRSEMRSAASDFIERSEFLQHLAGIYAQQGDEVRALRSTSPSQNLPELRALVGENTDFFGLAPEDHAFVMKLIERITAELKGKNFTSKEIAEEINAAAGRQVFTAWQEVLASLLYFAQNRDAQLVVLRKQAGEPPYGNGDGEKIFDGAADVLEAMMRGREAFLAQISVEMDQASGVDAKMAVLREALKADRQLDPLLSRGARQGHPVMKLRQRYGLGWPAPLKDYDGEKVLQAQLYAISDYAAYLKASQGQAVAPDASDAALKRAAGIFYDFYLYQQISLLFARVWENPEQNKVRLEKLLALLYDKAAGSSGQKFSRYAGTSSFLLGSLIAGDEKEYARIERAALRLFPEYGAVSGAAAARHTRHGKGGSLPGAPMMDDQARLNAMDYALFPLDLVPALKRYVELKGRKKDDPEKLAAMSELLNIFSANPYLLTNPERMKKIEGVTRAGANNLVPADLTAGEWKEYETLLADHRMQLGNDLKTSGLRPEAGKFSPLGSSHRFSNIFMRVLVLASALFPGLENMEAEDDFVPGALDPSKDRLAWHARLNQVARFLQETEAVLGPNQEIFRDYSREEAEYYFDETVRALLGQEPPQGRLFVRGKHLWDLQFKYYTHGLAFERLPRAVREYLEQNPEGVYRREQPITRLIADRNSPHMVKLAKISDALKLDQQDFSGLYHQIVDKVLLGRLEQVLPSLEKLLVEFHRDLAKTGERAALERLLRLVSAGADQPEGPFDLLESLRLFNRIMAPAQFDELVNILAARAAAGENLYDILMVLASSGSGFSPNDVLTALRRSELRMAAHSQEDEDGEGPWQEVNAVVSSEIVSHHFRRKIFVEISLTYWDVEDTMIHLSYDGNEVQLPSYITLLSMVNAGTPLTIKARGPKAAEALVELKRVLEAPYAELEADYKEDGMRKKKKDDSPELAAVDFNLAYRNLLESFYGAGGDDAAAAAEFVRRNRFLRADIQHAFMFYILDSAESVLSKALWDLSFIGRKFYETALVGDNFDLEAVIRNKDFGRRVREAILRDPAVTTHFDKISPDRLAAFDDRLMDEMISFYLRHEKFPKDNAREQARARLRLYTKAEAMWIATGASLPDAFWQKSAAAEQIEDALYYPEEDLPRWAQKKSELRVMPLKISAFRLSEIPVLTPEGMPAMTPLAPGVNSFAFASAVQTFGIGDAAWTPEIRGLYREYLSYWIHASFGSALKWQNVSFSSLLARRGLSKNEPLRIFRSYQELPGADAPETRALADFLAANRGAGLLIHAPSADPEAVRGFVSRLGGEVMSLRRARGENGGADVRVVSDSGALKFLKQAKYHRALVYADDAAVADRLARTPAVKDRRNVLFVHNNVTADPLRQTAAFLAALDEVLTRPVLPSSVRRAGELLGEHLEMLREVRALLQASA